MLDIISLLNIFIDLMLVKLGWIPNYFRGWTQLGIEDKNMNFNVVIGSLLIAQAKRLCLHTLSCILFLRRNRYE
ncbi:hypothetical protein H70357_27305 [Paenibacillus sp. FSL H7-0357]|nr:hypothetical protein H70357_27305 [Paenibacillus sp. FSL H7-0357]